MKENSLFKFIKLYRWRSIFFRYLFSFFLIILAIFIPYNIFIWTYYNYVLEKEITDQSTTVTLKSKEIFDLLTSEFFADYRLASNSSSVQSYLTSASPSEEVLFNCKDMLTSMTSDSDIIEEAFLYDLKNGMVLSSRTGRTSEPDGYNWTYTYASTKLSFMMFPRKVHSQDFNTLYICSEITDSHNSPIGVFCASLDYTNFVDIVKRSFEEEPDRIFIVSDIGLILYSDSPDLINTIMFEHGDLYAAFNSAKQVERNSIFYDDTIISVAKSTVSHLLLMSYNNRSNFIKDFTNLKILLLLGGISIFVLSFFLSLFISLRQYHSVAVIMDSLNDPDKLAMNKNERLSEFFYISHTIADISHENSHISSELDEKVAALKKYQIAALQAQINPHFLFNTLQLINLSIMKEVKKDIAATRLISLLSNLLHYSYDTEHYTVTVQQEIDNALKYLEIQQVRYKDHLRIISDISDECTSFETVKLILQPFIENSIIHGLKGKTEEWLIVFRCYLRNDSVVYEISDNGCGIPPAQLDRLNTSIESLCSDTPESIGILNIAQRLRLIFGSQCSLRLESASRAGTTVILEHKALNDLSFYLEGTASEKK